MSSTSAGTVVSRSQETVESKHDLSDEDEEMLDRSFNIYILLYILHTLTKNAELQRLIERDVKGGPFFQNMLGIIEIARDDVIEKVYFRKPNACNMLTYEAKQVVPVAVVLRGCAAVAVASFL